MPKKTKATKAPKATQATKKRRYIALLRGINVGGHTVKMDRLAKLFEEIGLKNVETFIASGNVIFESASNDADALERKVATHLERSLGYAVRHSYGPTRIWHGSRRTRRSAIAANTRSTSPFSAQDRRGNRRPGC
jgi:hypothetical protein